MSDGSVFVILNESTPKGVDIPVTEIVGQAFYSTLAKAVYALADIAEEYEIYVEPDASSVYVPCEGTHLESDEFYIVELMEENDG